MQSELTRTLSREGAHERLRHPSLQLRLSVPGQPERRVPLGLHPLVVGTAPDCDVQLDAPGLSRRHCELSLTDAGVRLRDLGSKNGTTLQGVRVLDAILPLQAVAAAGPVELSLVREGPDISVPLSQAPRFGQCLGLSVAMRALFATLQRVAPTQEPLLLLGESGTGKELLARAVHEASPVAQGPFVVLDCGALTPSLVEAELFGHTKGAFTGAAYAREGLLAEANGGTLFIDEVGELPLELQPKLLRALESGEVRAVGANGYRQVKVRVVAATHRNLRALATSGRFREDLYYRLAVVEAHVPALRERLEDIPLLVEHFLAQRQPPATLADLPPDALALLQAHRWPGNVRELRNAVARLLILPQSALPLSQPEAAAGGSPAGEALTHLPLKEARGLVVEQFERAYLAAQLRRHGSTPAAAKAMGVSRQLVHRMVQAYGLARGDDGADE